MPNSLLMMMIDFSSINKSRVNNDEIETVKYFGVFWDRSMSPKSQVEEVVQNVTQKYYT